MLTFAFLSLPLLRKTDVKIRKQTEKRETKRKQETVFYVFLRMSLANIGKFKLSLKALILSVFTFICFLVFSNVFCRTKIFLAFFSLALSLRDKDNKLKINKRNSTIQFLIDDRMSTARIGFFSPPKGEIFFDKKDPENSSFKVALDVRTINTKNKLRDNDLLSDNFLFAKKYPYINFESSKIIKTNEGFFVIGNIKIKDVVKEISIPFQYSQNMSEGLFKSEFSINRLDFNIGSLNETMGDSILIRLNVSVSQ